MSMSDENPFLLGFYELGQWRSVLDTRQNQDRAFTPTPQALHKYIFYKIYKKSKILSRNNKLHHLSSNFYRTKTSCLLSALSESEWRRPGIGQICCRFGIFLELDPDSGIEVARDCSWLCEYFLLLAGYWYKINTLWHLDVENPA